MSSEISSPDLLAPYDIIFSCAICQTTISELYRRPRTDHGFTSGVDQERVVTRLWLTECGHLTCSDHLDGGGTRCQQLHLRLPADMRQEYHSTRKASSQVHHVHYVSQKRTTQLHDYSTLLWELTRMSMTRIFRRNISRSRPRS